MTGRGQGARRGRAALGFGLAPWVDMPLTTTGVYGARGRAGPDALRPGARSGGEPGGQRQVELPWRATQAILVGHGGAGGRAGAE